MPKVEIIRPNRSEPRYFSSCDAARVCRNVVHDRNLPREVVLACVAKGLGFKTISLPPPEVKEAFLRPSPLPAVRGISQLLRLLMKTLPSFAARIQVALDLMEQVEGYLETLSDKANAMTVGVDELLRDGSCKCKSNTTGYT